MRKKHLIAILITAVMAILMIPSTVFAADAGPAIDKTVVSNNDGTYTLSLSVTGRTSSSSASSKADVIVVFDKSESMRTSAGYNQTRLSVAKTAVNNLATELMSNNTTAKPDQVRMSLISFGNTAGVDISNSTNLTNYKNTVNRIQTDGATNWEDALRTADTLVDSIKNDANRDSSIYVIFVSDGDPTMRLTKGNNYADYNRYWNNNTFNAVDSFNGKTVYGGGYYTETNYNYCYDNALDEAKKLSDVNFYGVGVFGNIDRMKKLTNEVNGNTDNYYNASDSDALNAAFEAIVKSINDTAGFTDVKVTDNVTAMTSTSKALTNVDSSSFTYTRSDGKEYTGPKAVYQNQKVTWDMGNTILENGVTYTVSFKVWPSQDAYDLVAALKNGTKSYDSLTADEKSQIIKDGDNYSLRTNTEKGNKVDYTKIETRETDVKPAGTTKPDGTIAGNDGYTYKKEGTIWKGTKTTSGSTDLPMPTAMSLTESSMPVTKDWIGGEPSGNVDVKFELMIDGKPSGKIVTLNKANNWTSDVVIAPGLIVNDEELEAGHDYTLRELDDSDYSGSYRYEFVSDEHHPMLVDSATTIVDKNGNDSTSMTGTNYRKSNLSISKAVTGTEDRSKLFTYKIKVTDKLGDDVWFSIGDGNDAVVKSDGRVTGATAEQGSDGKPTGYYYAKSGTELTVKIKAGENIYFTNLPKDSTYSIEEVNLPKGYSFDNVVIGDGTDTKTEKTAAVSGTIDQYNASYTAAYTNKYAAKPTKASIPVEKILTGENAPDITGAFEFELKATDKAPLPAETKKTNPSATGGKVTFGDIEYTAAGTYTYNITESGHVDGVVNDASASTGKTVQVVVKDNGEGQLVATVNGGKDLTFTNSYKQTQVQIPVVKNLSVPEGFTGPSIKEAYTFTLEPQGNAPATDSGKMTIKNPGEKGGSAEFDSITFKEPGDYVYTVTETGSVTGVKNDTKATKTVTVKVTRDGDNMTATLAGDDLTDGEVVFNNTYAPKKADTTVDVTKKVTGHEAIEPFEFSLTPDSSNPVDGAVIADGGNKVTTSDKLADGATETKSFGKITFSKPGTYKFSIKEESKAPLLGQGWTYDNKDAKVVTVTVKENAAEGKLEIVNVTGNNPTFENVYKTEPVEQELIATKAVKGHDAIESFNFKLALASGDASAVKIPSATAQTAADMKDGATEQVSFGKVEFSKAGTYTFNVTETTTTTHGGWTYDSNTKQITVTVKDNDKGKLVIDSVTGNDPTFTNTYEAKPVSKTLNASKLVTGHASIEAFEITLKLKSGDAEGVNIGNGDSVKTADTLAAGTPVKMAFKELAFTKAGTYVFTVDETTEKQDEGWTYDKDTYDITVTVTDDNNGQLVAEVTGDNPTFTNVYEAKEVTASIPVEKILDGSDAPDITGKYTFTLKSDVPDQPMPEVTEQKNPDADGGEVSFGDITYNAPGVYTYTVTEEGKVKGVVNDATATKTVTVNVTDNNKGQLVAKVNAGENGKVTFTNAYRKTQISIPVVKQLEVTDGTAPKIKEAYEFKIEAVTDGAPLPEVTSKKNPEENGGSVTFGSIVFDEPGDYEYKITESGEVAHVTNDADAASGKNVTVHVVRNDDNELVIKSVDGDLTSNGEVVFTNTYKPASTTAEIPVSKVLEVKDGTAPDITEAYTFKLEGKNDAPMPETTELKNPDADGGKVTFGEIKYDHTGTYTYKVTESGSVTSVTNDAAAESGKTVTVQVSDDNGKLKATITEGADLTFTNTYEPEKTKASIPVEKILNVKDGKGKDIKNAYTFTLEGKDKAPMPETTSLTNPSADGGKVSFGDIEFTKTGTYSYTVTESGSVENVTNDKTATKNVTIKVEDKDGKLVATITEGKDLKFTNDYEPKPVEANIPVEKVLEVKDGTAPDITGDYTFTLEGKDKAPMPDVTELKNPDADGGEMSFGKIKYTKTGTYEYTVTESGEVANITNDETATKTVIVEVTDDNGQLKATIKEGKDLKFTNSYEPKPVKASIPVEKVLNVKDGNAPDITGAYTFTLEGKDKAPMPETTSLTNPSADGGKVSFGDIEFTKTGIYNYTVTESGEVANVTNDATATKDVTIEVTDNDGQLKATITSGKDLKFTNTYAPEKTTASIPVKKVLEVKDGTAPDIKEAYTFTLAGEDNAPLPEVTELKNPDADGGEMSFGDITFDKTGTYKYTVTESGEVANVTNDKTAAKSVTIKVEDKDGKLVATITDGEDLTFTNTYEPKPVKASIPVEKVLEVKDGTAPDITNAYTFTLAGKDKAPMPAVTELTNPDADGGKVSFGDIEYTKTGTYNYTVTETGEVAQITNDKTATKDVTVEVTDDKGQLKATITSGKDLKFTNTYKPAATTAKIPVEKVLEVKDGTAPDITEAYTFTLEGKDKAPMPETTELVNPDADGGKVSFGDITFDKTGTYKYTVTESGDVDHITNDKDATKDVTITVTDENGKLKAEITDGKNLKFTNTYKPAKTTASIPVEKILSAPEGVDAPAIDGKYTFTLTAEDGVPMPEKTELVNPDADGGEVSFGDIEYTTTGTYEYTVTESGKVKGIVNDQYDSKKVTVVVTDDNGVLSASVNGGETLQFTNSYKQTEVSIPVVKKLDVTDGTAPKIKEEYTFKIAAVTKDAPLPETTEKANPADDGGMVTFGSIIFDEPGDYEYKITESGEVAHVTNDAAAESGKTVTVHVVRDENKELKIDSVDGDVDDNGQVVFTNTYKPAATTADIPVEKILKVADGNGTDITKAYTFTLEGKDKAPMPEKTELTNPDADGGKMTFEGIKFTKTGTYNYTVTEAGKVANVTNDENATKDVTIEVTDENGQLKATVTTGKDLKFTNTYKPTATTASIPVEKILEVKDGTAPDIKEAYSFELKSKAGTPMPEVTTLKNPDADGGEMSFGDITFDKTGTYEYTVTETGEVANVTNDETATKTVKIVVTDEKGQLKATVNGGETLEFKNTYEPTAATASIPVTKVLEVKDGTAPDITEAYTFKLEGKDKAPMPEKTELKNPDADGGKVSFGKITYTKTGTYKYTVTESGDVANVTNDQTATKEVTVEVTDNKGQLEAKVTDGKDLTFTNTYEPKPITADIPVEKILKIEDGEGKDITKAFTFTLAGKDKAPMPETTELTNPDADGGKMTFEGIKFTKTGTYNYTVTESGKVANVTNDENATKDVTIEVTDDNGQLKATITSGKDLKFTNTYKPTAVTASIPVQKTLEVKDGNAPDIEEAYSFELKSKSGTPMPEETVLKNPDADGGEMSFGVITFDKTGTYEYTVTESGSVANVTNDKTATKTVKVVVTDDNGKLKAVVNDGETLEFKNTYEPTAATANIPVTKVLKVVDGTAPSIKEAYTFTLAGKDNAPLPEKTELKNPNADGGSVSFGEITFTKTGTYEYKVTEKGSVEGVTNDAAASSGKTVIIEVEDVNGTLSPKIVEGKDLTFTNTYSPKPASLDGDGEAVLKVTKKVEGNDSIEAFNFKLTPANEKTKEAISKQIVEVVGDTAKTSAKIEDGKTETAKFGTLTFHKTGTYTFTVKETNTDEGKKGWTYDTSEKTITVKVTDADSKGQLKATVEGNNPTFTNTYKANPVSLEDETALRVTKVVTGHDAIEAFDFKMTPADDKTQKAVSDKDVVLTNDEVTTSADIKDGASETVKYGKITFKEVGTYTFDVKETTQPGAGGWSYDNTTSKQIVVKVTDDKKGSLVAEVSGNNPTFTNTFAPAALEGETAVTGTKTLVGRDMLKDETFSFTMSAADDKTQKAVDDKDIKISKADTSVSGGKNGEATTFSFGRITFDKVGTYKFNVVEEAGNAPGVTYDSETKTFTVEVTNDNGILKAVQKGKPEFKNSYKAEGSYTPAGTKVLYNDKENLITVKEGQFNFTVKYTAADETVATGTTGTGKEAPINFSTLSYSTEGDNSLEKLVADGIASKEKDGDTTTYTINYIVTEDPSDNDALQHNTENKTFTVYVSDNGTGELSVESDDGLEVDFENSYISDTAEVAVSGLKVIKGDRPLNEGEFTFELVGEDEAPLPEETVTKNTAGGSVQFGKIEYTKDSLGDETEKTFHYTINEEGNLPNVKNDSSKNFDVTVKDDGNGHITAETSPESAPLFTFENVYTPQPVVASVSDSISITKNLEGRSMKDGEFKFEMKDEAGNVVATGTNDDTGLVEMSTIEFVKAGTYTYTVNEVKGDLDRMTYDESVYNVTATVTDHYDGKEMDVEWTYGDGDEIVFNNKYERFPVSIDPPVTKIITGDKPKKAETFTFKMVALDGAPMPEGSEGDTKTIDIKGAGTKEFGVITYDKAGTYEYKISEVKGKNTDYEYDTAIYTLTVVVTEGDGQMIEESTYTKDGDEYVGDITFSNKYEKFVPEPEKPKKPVEPKEPSGPDTGDQTPIAPWAGLMALAGAGLAGIGVHRRRRHDA